MKVALIDPSLFTAPYDQELANGLSAKGCRVMFYSRPCYDYESWAGGKAADHHSVFYRFTSKLSDLPRSISIPVKGVEHIFNMCSLAGRLAQEKPDLIHFQWCPLPLADGFLLSRLRRIAPVVLTVHDPHPFNGDPTAALQRLGYRRLLNRFDRLIVHTSLAQRKLVDYGIAAEKIDIIPHGNLNIDRGETAGACPPEDTQPAGHRGAVTYLLLGKLKPYKGVDTLIRAVARMPEETRDKCRFVIAGKPYMDVHALEDLCQEQCVEHLFEFDFRYLAEAEISRLISNASVLVFPYREIDASGVLMATLPYGKPVIASRLGIFETLLRDGEHGFLVEPRDEQSLAESLVRMTEDTAARALFADNVARLAVRQPSWCEIAESTLRTYGLALDARKGPYPSNGEPVAGDVAVRRRRPPVEV